MSITDQIINVESGGDPYAQNPYSSAGGLGQFTNQTWLNTLRTHRPDLFAAHSPQELLAMKTDPQLARDMVGALAEDNGASLRSHGLDPSPGNLYLAHFAGAGGAAKVLGADDTSPVSQILGMDVVSANPFLRNMTVADLKNWASRKMGGGDVTQPAAPAAGGGTMMAMQSPPSGGGDIEAAMRAASGASPAAAGGQPAASPFGALGGMLGGAGQQQAQQPAVKAPEIHIKYPEPPGLVRARLLARAMAANPLKSIYSYGDNA